MPYAAPWLHPHELGLKPLSIVVPPPQDPHRWFGGPRLAVSSLTAAAGGQSLATLSHGDVGKREIRKSILLIHYVELES